ncbi:ATP synthase subunit I [Tepidimicrobium xylanilyticum]|uniref:ATP synthase subunit I n=1 Tax=Tepidimicrobium xylanilyticum TaxID=1123352 RepID=UPI00265357CB|nr:ATP synthase subunit I [Tepidimicrobium xylanilyticum]GMG95546.1 ATP synthase subunit I [Tepidimicrobium xylanilyticum]
MNDDLIIDVAKRIGILSLIIIGTIFIFFPNPKPIILGYFFGTIISIISFKLMGNTINKAVKRPPRQATSYAVFHYMLRFIIYAIVLIIASKADYLNFFATAIGLTMVKNTIVLSTIFDKNFK